MTLENYVHIKAQELALRLNAKTVTYNVENESWTYFCGNENKHVFTKLELIRLVKSDINKKVYSIK